MKPSYNSVDMVEVELFDDDRKPREFSKELTAVSFVQCQMKLYDYHYLCHFKININNIVFIATSRYNRSKDR